MCFLALWFIRIWRTSSGLCELDLYHWVEPESPCPCSRRLQRGGGRDPGGKRGGGELCTVVWQRQEGA